MSDKTVYAIEMVSIYGDIDYHISSTPESLGDFIRVNAAEASTFRVSSTSLPWVSELRIAEIFGEDNG